jgi:hypothetical protein
MFLVFTQVVGEKGIEVTTNKKDFFQKKKPPKWQPTFQ